MDERAKIILEYEVGNKPKLINITGDPMLSLGYTADDFISGVVDLIDRIHKDDTDIVNNFFSSHPTKSPVTTNIRIRNSSGKIICFKIVYHKKQKEDFILLQLELLMATLLERTMQEVSSMTHIKAIMENTDDYIYFKDRNHVFTGASQTLVSLCDPAEHWTDLLGKTDYDVFPEEYADIYYRLEKQVFSGLPVAKEIQEFLSKKGLKGWVDNRKYPVHDDNGNMIGLFGIARDITPQKKLEILASHVPGVIYQYQLFADGRSTFPYASNGIRDIYGVTPEQVQEDASPVFDVLHPDDFENIVESIQLSANNLKKWNIIYRVNHPSGKTIWVEGQATPERLEDGSTLWHGYIQDISERKIQEEQLGKSEEKYRLAVEATRDGIWDWDINSGDVEYTDSWYKILNASTGFNEFSNWEKRIHPDEKKCVLDSLQRHLEGLNLIWSNEHRLKTDNDQWIWVLGRGQVVERDENGKPLRMIGTITDISRQKNLEHELALEKRNLEQKILERTKEFLLAKENAEAANIEKSRFLANMSHELRTPMHAIHGFTNLALKREQDDKNKHFLENIEASTKRLTDLLNDLLDLSKLESGKMIVNLQKVDFSDIILSTLSNLESLIRDRNLVTDTSGIEQTSVKVDISLMTQVITNLMSNAIKFSPENGTIKLTCRIEEGHLLFNIEDEGIGVPDNEFESIFDSFVQSTKTMTNAGGTGLGLPITREIIDLHGGSVWVESPPKHKKAGSVFSFQIPLAEPES